MVYTLLWVLLILSPGMFPKDISILLSNCKLNVNAGISFLSGSQLQ